jgi:polar amino acid transport system permease protein
VTSPAPAEAVTPATKVVPVRHPWRWVAAAAIAVVVAQLVHGLVTNRRFRWDVFGDYFASSQVLDALRTTVELTALAMIIGTTLGILLAVGRLSPNPIVSGACWFYIWFFRGTPVLVQIYVWYFISAVVPRVSLGIPFGPEVWHGSANDVITAFVAATLALSLNEAAYMAEIVRAGILSVDEGQTEAASALGMTRPQVLRRIVLPQAMRVVIPPTGNETISMLKTTSLVSVISVVELTYAVQIVISRIYIQTPLYMVAIVWYLIVTSVLYVGQFYLERRFARGATRELPPTPVQRFRRMIWIRRGEVVRP